MAGQPTKYKPEYCELLIQHMSEGLSLEAFAGLVRVHRDTIYHWVKLFPEFKEAKLIGHDLSLLYWEKLGRDHVINETHPKEGSRSLNASVWIFNMRNRFRWSDGKDAGPDASAGSQEETFPAMTKEQAEELLNKRGGEK